VGKPQVRFCKGAHSSSHEEVAMSSTRRGEGKGLFARVKIDFESILDITTPSFSSSVNVSCCI
jgi:hypothetical protein